MDLSEGSNLGGHAVAGVQNGLVVVFSALVQAVAASFAVSHLWKTGAAVI